MYTFCFLFHLLLQVVSWCCCCCCCWTMCSQYRCCMLCCLSMLFWIKLDIRSRNQNRHLKVLFLFLICLIFSVFSRFLHFLELLFTYWHRKHYSAVIFSWNAVESLKISELKKKVIIFSLLWIDLDIVLISFLTLFVLRPDILGAGLIVATGAV